MGIEDREWYREEMCKREGGTKLAAPKKGPAPVEASRSGSGLWDQHSQTSVEAPAIGPATVLWLLVVAVVIALGWAVVSYIRKH